MYWPALLAALLDGSRGPGWSGSFDCFRNQVASGDATLFRTRLFWFVSSCGPFAPACEAGDDNFDYVLTEGLLFGSGLLAAGKVVWVAN